MRNRFFLISKAILIPCFLIIVQIPTFGESVRTEDNNLSSYWTNHFIFKEYCLTKNEGKYNCENMKINIEAYLDVRNLPIFNNDLQKLCLVDSPEHYANGKFIVELVYSNPKNPNFKLEKNFQKKLCESQPIKVYIRDAIIRKVMQPTNGVLVEYFYLETETLKNVSFYKVKTDGTEELIEQ